VEDDLEERSNASDSANGHDDNARMARAAIIIIVLLLVLIIGLIMDSIFPIV